MLARFICVVLSVVVFSVQAGLTGPYGMAINLSGGIFASIIKGIDAIFEKDGYDFRKAEFRKLYVKNFCAYNEILTDIERLTKPEKRLRDLNDLKEYQAVKIADIVANCPECALQKTHHDKQAVIYTLIETVKTKVAARSQSERNVWSQCSYMATF